MTRCVSGLIYNARMAPKLTLVISRDNSTACSQKSASSPRDFSSWPNRHASISMKLNRLTALKPEAVRVVEFLIDGYLNDIAKRGSP